MRSLTREEAQRRADLIQVHSYDVDVDLTRGPDVFGSVTTIRFAATGPGPTFLDVAPRELHRVRLNGEPQSLESFAGSRLPLEGLRGENELVVEATMAYSNDGEGLHRHVDPADGKSYLYAMSFLDAAPRWFACFDQPDLKASFTLHVTCPTEWAVVGNAPAEQAGDGRWHLRAAHPLATYFTTLAAGPYQSVITQHDGIRLGLHARASLAAPLQADADEVLELTRRGLDEYHRLFGVRYPWGEYHQVFVPDFNAGAMENPGCVTIRDSYVFRSRVTEQERAWRAILIAHEMAHMWFGNLVTMRWWNDLWLNESFAEYLGHRVSDAVSDYHTWAQFSTLRKAWGYAADRRPSTHPVAGNGADDAQTALQNFDGISYAKGAAVLRQLATRLGDDVLLGGLRKYFDDHAFANATFADLIGAWTAAGAHDLDAWADAWLRTAGLDTLRGEATNSGVVVRRVQTGAGPARRAHAVAIGAYDGQGHELVRTRTVVDEPVTLPVSAVPALVLPDASDETWAKTSFAEDTWRQLPGLLTRLDDQLARVSVWNALRLAVADAEVAPSLALGAIEASVPTERSEVLIGTITRWAIESVAGLYLADQATRDQALVRLAAVMDATSRAAAPGSGRQLTGLRAFLLATSDVATMQGWLRGEALLPGMVVDDELRWAIVERLCALGALDAGDIEAELARDRSAQGVIHAAKCRALRPDAATKAEAWQAIMHSTDLANSELYALAEGFWHPEQVELTAPFVGRYFEEIAQTARLRRGWVVARVALLAYPSTAVDESTLALGDALLDRQDLDAGVRRSVVDAADDLRRALASRHRFA